MKSYIIIPVLLLCAGPVLSAPNLPDDVLRRVADRVTDADSNSDGMVTLVEWQNWRARQFSTFDRNGDGYLSAADLPKFAARGPKADLMQQMLSEADSNGDGRVSQNEYVHAPSPAFARIDRDGNAVLDGYEIRQARGG